MIIESLCEKIYKLGGNVMKKRRLIALVLSLVMLLSSTITGLAEEDSTPIDASTWTAEDFTYGSYEKLLYGCDYTRQITIKGSAITGFSESGEAKLALNKDLVIPAVDDEGYQIVGIAQNAFYQKGLTSVTFPTGMMVDYDDTITNKVTKRGNFVIAENAFAGNELTSVTLPEGVIAVLPHAFNNNKIETVKLPKTIWWIETMAFANNRITTVNFPTTCDFQLEMHGMAFAKNFIKSVRLPDYTEVVNKETFFLNTGMEPISADAKDDYKTYEVDGVKYDAGIVYMYTDNAELEGKDRIHHTGKSTSSQYSYVQKLIVNDGDDSAEDWNISDFTYEGTVITGLSESGIAKRKVNKDLVIPELNREGQYITEIAAAKAGGCGLFAAEGEGFDSVYLPSGLKVIGNYAFQNNGLKEVTFPSKLEKIGNIAFQTNQLTSVILPDTVTSLGTGAFATNPTLERISLSKGLTEIPDSAFGCSDGDNWMEKLTSIELHEGITKIGQRAFAANNFSEIKLPSTVKEIGKYAFATKNYLSTPCKVTLNEGLEKIGDWAFRNKVIEEITLPSTVTKISANTFRKEYSNGGEAVITTVYVSKAQYDDKTNFANSSWHKFLCDDVKIWTADDFTYGNETFEIHPASESGNKITVNARVVTGFSESGKEKFAVNKSVTIPSVDTDGNKVQGVGRDAFNPGSKATDADKITELTLPANVKAPYDDSTWETTGKGLTERGDFFIGYGAFRYNNLTSVEIPDGVIFIHTYAFGNNENLSTVSIPKSTMMMGQGVFYKCAVSSLTFADKNDFGLQLDNQTFSTNKLEAVQLPSNLEKIHKWSFIQNTGKEEVVSSGTTAEKKGGVVYLYIDAVESETNILGDKVSNVHKIFFEKMPDIEKDWNESNFTYDEAGTTITGLSDSGKAKIKVNPALVLPKVGPTGEAITALGNGKTLEGIFVYTETVDGVKKHYAPSSVKLPSTLIKIGNFAFALDPSFTYEQEMTSITLPEGLVEIGQTAFQNSKLTSVSIPDSVTTMGTGAFTGSASLTSVKLSKNLKDIPASAFSSGTAANMSLKEVVIPEGVESIGSKAFDTAHVEKLTLPSTLKTIGANAFDNHQLTELEIPGSVTTIGNYAFRVKNTDLPKKLETLILHEGLETIGKEAFIGNAIKEVNLPSTVVLSAKNTTADAVFGKKNAAASPIVILKTADQSKVETFNTEFANTWSHIVVYDSLAGTGWSADDFTYDEDTATITGWSESGHAKRAANKELVLPTHTPGGKAIVAIGAKAFMIPNDEVEVTKFGIDSPNGMVSVVIPETVTEIGESAFAQNALTEVDLTGLTTIGARAFYGNDLVKALIPDTVTSLGEGAFATNDITEIRLSSAVTVIPQGLFSMNIRLESIEIPNTVTEIGDTAFAGARLTSLTIPESVTKIGRKAFHLHHLTELTISGNVKEIGESAFEGTYKATTLKSLTIEEGVEVIGKWAFKEALLETVLFPNSIKEVGDEPFLNNKGKVNENLENSHVVEVTTFNRDHEAFEDETYIVIYLGDYEFVEFEDLVEVEYETAMFTGDAYEPEISIPGLTQGKDYKVEYKNNVEVGTATIVLTGLGRYVGVIEKTFVITDNPLVKENEDLKEKNEDLQYENERLEQEIEKLEAEIEALKAELAEKNKHKCPDATVVVQGTDNKDTSVTVEKTENSTTTETKVEDEVETEVQTETTDVDDEKEDESSDATVGAEAGTDTGNDNKFIIGLVIGAIVGGSVCFLLFGKKKKVQA